MEKAEFIEKAKAAGADQEYINWALAFNAEKKNGFSMPLDLILKEFISAQTSIVY